MATVSRRLGAWENEAVLAEMTYDDVTMRVNGLRVINNGTGSLYLFLIRVSDGRLYDHIFGAGSATFAISTGVASRITLSDLGRGHFEGCYIGAAYPGS